MQLETCFQQKGPTVKYIWILPQGKSAKGKIHRQRENPPTAGREDPRGSAERLLHLVTGSLAGHRSKQQTTTVETTGGVQSAWALA